MMFRSGEVVKYGGAIDCYYQIIKNEGFIALWRDF
jgi:hypothetical protein